MPSRGQHSIKKMAIYEKTVVELWPQKCFEPTLLQGGASIPYTPVSAMDYNQVYCGLVKSKYICL